jgi:phospholipid/cholesterol/gamma-HCH transport system substrate-binding protein
LIEQFYSFVNGLAGDRAQIASTINGLNGLTTGLTNQISQQRPALDQDIAQLANVTGSLAANQQSVDAAIKAFPGFLTALDKVSSSGSYLSVYICNLTVIAQGKPDISLIPGVTPPQPGDPLTLPSGPIGDQAQHTANCR